MILPMYKSNLTSTWYIIQRGADKSSLKSRHYRGRSKSSLSTIPPLQSPPSPSQYIYIPHKKTRFSSNEYLMTTLIGLVPDTSPLEAPAPDLPGWTLTATYIICHFSKKKKKKTHNQEDTEMNEDSVGKPGKPWSSAGIKTHHALTQLLLLLLYCPIMNRYPVIH